MNRCSVSRAEGARDTHRTGRGEKNHRWGQRGFFTHCVAILAAALVVVTLSEPQRATAAGVNLEIRQSESATPLPSGTSLYTDASADGGKSVAYDSAATVNYDFGVSSDHRVTQVTLRSRNSSQSGASATINIVVDGKAQTAQTMAATATTYQDRTWAVNLGPGTHTIGVRGSELSGARCLYSDRLVLSGDVASTPPTVADSDGDGINDAADPADTDPAVTETPCDILERIRAAPSGGTVNLPDGCTARTDVVLTKPITLIGGPGVSLRGTNVFTFTPVGNGNWRSDQVVPSFTEPTTTSDPVNPTLCESGGTCDDVEEVFVDEPDGTVSNASYTRQLDDGADPGAGEFALDAQRRVILGFDPTGKRIEVGTRQRAVGTNANAFTMRDVSVLGVSNYRQYGAVQAGGGSATLDGVRVGWTHSLGLSCGGRAPCSVTNSRFDHNGMTGISTHKAQSLLIQSVRADHNGNLPDADYNDSFESGGLKVTGDTGNANRVVENSEFGHNTDRGVWLDVDANNVTVRNNRIHHNEQFGIHYEISNGAQIYGNAIWENGWTNASTVNTASNSAGMYISAAGGADIHDNLIAWNNDGISTILDNRRVEAANKIRNNTVVMEQRPNTQTNLANHTVATDGAAIPLPAGSNQGYDNAYFFVGGEIPGKARFQWRRSGESGYLRTGSLSAFTATPGEERGRYLTEAEKDTALRTAGIPLAPER